LAVLAIALGWTGVATLPPTRTQRASPLDARWARASLLSSRQTTKGADQQELPEGLSRTRTAAAGAHRNMRSTARPFSSPVTRPWPFFESETRSLPSATPSAAQPQVPVHGAAVTRYEGAGHRRVAYDSDAVEDASWMTRVFIVAPLGCGAPISHALEGSGGRGTCRAGGGFWCVRLRAVPPSSPLGVEDMGGRCLRRRGGSAIPKRRRLLGVANGESLAGPRPGRR
jgi:hypothetical protein